MEETEAFYRETNACVKEEWNLCENFALGVGVRQGYLISLWLFHIFMEGCMRDMKTTLGKFVQDLY